MLEVDTRRVDHEGQGAVAVLVLVLHVHLPAVTVLAIRTGLGSLNPSLPLQDIREDQEEK